MNNFIKIKNLYKIFGNNTTEALNLVKTGLSKEKLLEKTNCVLGLNNINLNIPKGKIHVIMGLSGSGKSTLIRHLNRLIEPCLLYTSPSPRDRTRSRMPSSA